MSEASSPDDERRAHLSTIARGGTLNVVGAVVSGLLSFVLVVIVTRGLGVESAGAFFIAVALFSLLAKTLELGADTGLVRFISRYRALGELRDLNGTIAVAIVPVVLASVVVAVALFTSADALAPRIAKGSAPGQVGDLLRLLAPFLPLGAAYTVLLAGTRGFGTMKPTVAIDRFAKPALQPALAFAVLLAGLGTLAVLASWVTPIGIGTVLAVVWLARLTTREARRITPETPAPRGRRELASEFWRFTAPRGLAGFFQVAIVWVDTLLIGALRSTREAAIYAAATRYLLIGTFATMAIVLVMGPKISELLTRNDVESARSVYQVSTGWLVLLAWPINFTLLLFTPVMLAVFGKEFQAGSAALVILAATMFLATAVGPVDVVLLMAGKSSWNLLNTLAALILNVGLNLLLIPVMGITGAAVAWSVSIAANNLLPLAQTWRALHLHPFGHGFRYAVGVTCVAFGGAGLVSRLILGPTVTGFVVYAVISVAVYLVLLRRYRRELDIDVFLGAIAPGRTRRGEGAPTPA
jgi:O-antigen/teichoic acid export membrane protein